MALGAFLLVALVVGGLMVIRTLTGPGEGERFHFVVPAGTAEAAAAGEAVSVLPAQLTLKVGDHLVIRNDDSQTQLVGPFAVRAGEELDHEFRRSGVYEGECTVHSSGHITIVVEPR